MSESAKKEGESTPLQMGALFFTCIIAFFLASKYLSKGDSKLIGHGAPALTLPMLTSDKSFAIEAYRGKPVLLDFWASWCGPCRAQAPIVDRVAKEFEKDGLVVIGVNTNDTEEDARAYLRAHSFSYPIAFDGDRSAASAYGVNSFPTMVVVAKDGTVKAVSTGLTGADRLSELVRDVL